VFDQLCNYRKHVNRKTECTPRTPDRVTVFPTIRNAIVTTKRKGHDRVLSRSPAQHLNCCMRGGKGISG
jgi:hypothetical protein